MMGNINEGKNMIFHGRVLNDLLRFLNQQNEWGGDPFRPVVTRPDSVTSDRLGNNTHLPCVNKSHLF